MIVKNNVQNNSNNGKTSQFIISNINEKINDGILPWRNASYSYNIRSKKPYSLLNQALLPWDGAYATKKQWANIGCVPKRGESPFVITFWKILQVESQPDKKNVGTLAKKTIPILKTCEVFHISQIRGNVPENSIIMKKNEEERYNIDTIISNYSSEEDILSSINIKFKKKANKKSKMFFKAVMYSVMKNLKTETLTPNDILIISDIVCFHIARITGTTEIVFPDSAALISYFSAAMEKDEKYLFKIFSKAEKVFEKIL